MSVEKLLLADMVGRDYLQKLQDSITTAANVTAMILDAGGEPITNLTNARGICKLLEDTCRENSDCRETHRKLCRMVRETEEPATLTCPRTGMTVVSVPIFLEDTFIGAWFVGHIRFPDDPKEPFVQAALKKGLDSTSAEELLKDIPVFSRPHFDTIVAFMSILTGEIVNTISDSMEIKEKNVQLTELSKSLEYFVETLRTFADIPDVGVYLADLQTGKVII